MFWFSSDWHLSHANVIKHSNRPFKNIDEMNKTILDNFFSMVKKGDTFYHLGDISWDAKLALEVVRKIRGNDITFILIKGNHDDRTVKEIYEHCNKITDHLEIKTEYAHITMNHYALRVWNKSHFGSWQLFGHSHGTLKPEGKQWDVGVDNNNFVPLSLYDVKNIMDKRPNGFDYLNHNSKEE